MPECRSRQGQAGATEQENPLADGTFPSFVFSYLLTQPWKQAGRVDRAQRRPCFCLFVPRVDGGNIVGARTNRFASHSAEAAQTSGTLRDRCPQPNKFSGLGQVITNDLTEWIHSWPVWAGLSYGSGGHLTAPGLTSLRSHGSRVIGVLWSTGHVPQDRLKAD